MKFIWRNGWIPAEHFVRTFSPAPMVITDQIDPFKSMADGQMYESRAAYRAGLKARGMVETAGCNLPERSPVEPALTTGAISEAYDQCEAGHGAKPAERPPEPWEGSIEA